MGQILDSKTFRLFKEKGIDFSFTGNVASIFDFPNYQDLYNYDKNEKEADKKSLRDDWMQVGNDLKNSIEEYATSAK